MEVGTQKGLQMSLKKFVNYYKKPKEKRKQLLNVLSLEFSNTKLEKLVQGPKIVIKKNFCKKFFLLFFRKSYCN